MNELTEISCFNLGVAGDAPYYDIEISISHGLDSSIAVAIVTKRPMLNI